MRQGRLTRDASQRESSLPRPPPPKPRPPPPPRAGGAPCLLPPPGAPGKKHRDAPPPPPPPPHPCSIQPETPWDTRRALVASSLVRAARTKHSRPCPLTANSRQQGENQDRRHRCTRRLCHPPTRKLSVSQGWAGARQQLSTWGDKQRCARCLPSVRGCTQTLAAPRLPRSPSFISPTKRMQQRCQLLSR